MSGKQTTERKKEDEIQEEGEFGINCDILCYILRKLPLKDCFHIFFAFGYTENYDALLYGIRKTSVEMIRWALEEGISVKRHHIRKSVEHDARITGKDLDISDTLPCYEPLYRVSFCITKILLGYYENKGDKRDLALTAVRYSNICLFQELERDILKGDISFFEASSVSGDIIVMEYLKSRNYSWGITVTYSASKHGKKEALKWLIKEGCPVDKSASLVATKMNHNDIIEFLLESGVEMHPHIIREASKRGNIDIIEMGISAGLKTDDFSTKICARNRQYDCLKYLVSKGCPTTSMTCAYISLNGDLEMLKWARDIGIEWCKWSSMFASENGNIGCLEYCMLNGCYNGWDVWKLAKDNEHEDVIEWGKQSGFYIPVDS